MSHMFIHPAVTRTASSASLSDRHRHHQFQPRPPPEGISFPDLRANGEDVDGRVLPHTVLDGDGPKFHSHSLNGAHAHAHIGNSYPGSRSALAEANAQEARAGGPPISLGPPRMGMSPANSLSTGGSDSHANPGGSEDSTAHLTGDNGEGVATKSDLNNHGNHPSTSPQRNQRYLYDREQDPSSTNHPHSEPKRVQTLPLPSPTSSSDAHQPIQPRTTFSPDLSADPMKQSIHDHAHSRPIGHAHLGPRASTSTGTFTHDGLRKRRKSHTQGSISSNGDGTGQGKNKNGFGYAFLSNTGSEPGVDVRKDPGRYAELKEPARVTIVDYSSDGQGTRYDIPGSKLDSFLNSDEGKRPGGIPGGPEAAQEFRSVRWINVDGMNYDIIRTLGLKYDLHPLAIEDALRAAANPRSKVDFYANHLYAQILIQYINERDEDDLTGTSGLDGASGDGTTDEGSSVGTKVDKGKSKVGTLGRLIRMGGGKDMQSLPDGVEGVFEPVETYHSGKNLGKRPDPHRMTIDHLSAKYMIPLRKSVLSAFLMRDGTLITLSASPFSGILDPIYMRLENVDGLLRRTCDVSMLLEGVLDVVVDIAIEVQQAFERKILILEAGCLVNPQMEAVKSLHVIASQLTRLKRTLSPLMHLLYTLRDQDAQRAIASMIFARGQQTHDPHTHGSGTPSGTRPGPTSGLGMGSNFGSGMGLGMGIGGAETKGFISQTTRVYLSDVVDHLETVLSSIDGFIATCDHLTDYIFNMLSFITNESMERLSLVTVVFLPLTFLAGYFGMNFTGFGDIEGSVVYFWKIAAPLTAGFFIIFCYGYIKDLMGRGLRTLARKRRVEMVERQHELAEKNETGVKRHRARKF